MDLHIQEKDGHWQIIGQQGKYDIVMTGTGKISHNKTDRWI